MRYNAIIIDDEPPAVQGICELLQEHDEFVKTVGTASSGAVAIQIIDELKPDVVFIDIRLGDMSAFDVLRATEHRPHVVFTTAYDSYAVKAFDHAALDYLLKPIDSERLKATVERLSAKCTVTADKCLRKISGELNNKPLNRISSRIGKNHYVLSVPDIDVIEAQGYYAAVWVGDRRYPVRISLKELETRLSCRGFVRIHRKYVVNAARVSVINTSKWGTAHVKLKSPMGPEIPVSRRKIPQLRKIFARDRGDFSGLNSDCGERV